MDIGKLANKLTAAALVTTLAFSGCSKKIDKNDYNILKSQGDTYFISKNPNLHSAKISKDGVIYAQLIRDPRVIKLGVGDDKNKPYDSDPITNFNQGEICTVNDSGVQDMLNNRIPTQSSVPYCKMEDIRKEVLTVVKELYK